MKWSITIPGRPTSKGNSDRILRTRDGKPFIAPSTQAKSGELGARAYAAAHAAEGLPFQGPVVVEVEFRFRVPTSGENRKCKPGEPRACKPDRGNLLKLVEDALIGIAYVDDAQIVAGDVRKVWWEMDETFVEVREV